MEGGPLVTVDDYERLARERLPTAVYDYYAGGSGDEWTLRQNREAFDRFFLRPRVLSGVADRNLSTEVLSTPVSMPILIAPWAYQRMVHPEGEQATARAAARAGTIMVLSSTAESILEDVARASGDPKWYQLYVYKDRGFTAEMLHRAHAAGFAAIVFTVDAPLLGNRDRDARSGFEFPAEVATPCDFDPAISWDDLVWIRENAPLPLLVKGILTAEDARRAVEAGVDGIVVSNHGGRQLDGAPAAITALPEVADAAGGRVEVLMDGGIRRGVGVLKALALGASAVLVGRAAAWGLVVGGEQGVVDVLELLRRELDLALALVGCRSVADVDRSLVAQIG